MWWPTCYSYDKDKYIKLSDDFIYSKYKALVNQMKRLNPDIYIASAGPICFLDPEMFHHNFERNISSYF